MSERVLVTGGAGFLGSALVWALNERSLEDIVICDRLNSDNRWSNLAPLRFSDYVDSDDLLGLLEKGDIGNFDMVFHLGACSSTAERDMGRLMRNNYSYTRDIARWALKSGARFVYASSAATYGDGSAGMDDDNLDLDRLRPLNPYGYSKHLFDLHARRQGWLDRIVGLKFFNVFGPNESHKGAMRSLVHKAFDQINTSGRVDLFKSHRPDCEDGLQTRDFLYVKDAVAMALYLAERRDLAGIFNLGSGRSHTWVELAEAVFAAIGVPRNIEFVEMPEELRANYQYHTRAEIGKLVATGYSETITTLTEAVRDCVVNYLVPDKRLGDTSRSL